jgi:hypothetical protein
MAQTGRVSEWEAKTCFSNNNTKNNQQYTLLFSAIFSTDDDKIRPNTTSEIHWH